MKPLLGYFLEFVYLTLLVEPGLVDGEPVLPGDFDLLPLSLHLQSITFVVLFHTITKTFCCYNYFLKRICWRLTWQGKCSAGHVGYFWRANPIYSHSYQLMMRYFCLKFNWDLKKKYKITGTLLSKKKEQIRDSTEHYKKIKSQYYN